MIAKSLAMVARSVTMTTKKEVIFCFVGMLMV